VNIKLTAALLIIGFISVIAYSQDKTVILHGKIISNTKAIANVHIYNISKKRGTVSNDKGVFEIIASANDTLYISSLQYKKSTYLITEKNIYLKQIQIELTASVNELDEVFLKHLTGNLTLDMANKPKATTPVLGYVYDKKDLYKNTFNDQTDASNRPDPKANTNPIGGGAGISLPDRRYEALLKLKRELKQKIIFPDLLKHDLGIEYFTVTLSIPEEKINNFIAYCEYRGIVKKYHSNKQLEVIEILNEESKNYNAIKN